MHLRLMLCCFRGHIPRNFHMVLQQSLSVALEMLLLPRVVGVYLLYPS